MLDRLKKWLADLPEKVDDLAYSDCETCRGARFYVFIGLLIAMGVNSYFLSKVLN